MDHLHRTLEHLVQPVPHIECVCPPHTSMIDHVRVALCRISRAIRCAVGPSRNSSRYLIVSSFAYTQLASPNSSSSRPISRNVSSVRFAESSSDFFHESIRHLKRILEVTPEAIAHDLHPAYMATRWAKRQLDQRLIAVQHHHAHIVNCMADNQLSGDVIGVALDGTGYGSDGHIWGGEVLVTSPTSFTRAAHPAYTPMPGGDKAIHEPWRMALSHLWSAFGETWRDHAPAALLANVPSRNIVTIEHTLRQKTHAPLTSSCGRPFDAVAALVCGHTHVT